MQRPLQFQRFIATINAEKSFEDGVSAHPFH
jgi:hypothetical protein